MNKKVVSIITRAKQNLERSMAARKTNHEADWPEHSILCQCQRCMKQEFNYIKEMRKENRLAKARQKASN